MSVTPETGDLPKHDALHLHDDQPPNVHWQESGTRISEIYENVVGPYGNQSDVQPTTFFQKILFAPLFYPAVRRHPIVAKRPSPCLKKSHNKKIKPY